MKKILSILLIAGLLCSTAFAVEYMSTDKTKTIKMLVLRNLVTDSSDVQRTAVSTATIVPGTNRIIGYAVDRDNVSEPAEAWVALYDGADTSTTGLFAENEADATTAHAEFIYPYPRSISTQLIVRQGDNTVVTIFYDRK